MKKDNFVSKDGGREIHVFLSKFLWKGRIFYTFLCLPKSAKQQLHEYSFRDLGIVQNIELSAQLIANCRVRPAKIIERLLFAQPLLIFIYLGPK